MKDVYKVPCVKMLILGKLLRGWYLFEILHSLFTVKISKKKKKVNVSKIFCDEERNLFFVMKKEYKVSCVKTTSISCSDLCLLFDPNVI